MIKQVNNDELNKWEDLTQSPIHSHEQVANLDLIERFRIRSINFIKPEAFTDAAVETCPLIPDNNSPCLKSMISSDASRSFSI